MQSKRAAWLARHVEKMLYCPCPQLHADRAMLLLSWCEASEHHPAILLNPTGPAERSNSGNPDVKTQGLEKIDIAATPSFVNNFGSPWKMEAGPPRSHITTSFAASDLMHTRKDPS